MGPALPLSQDLEFERTMGNPAFQLEVSRRWELPSVQGRITPDPMAVSHFWAVSRQVKSSVPARQVDPSVKSVSGQKLELNPSADHIADRLVDCCGTYVAEFTGKAWSATENQPAYLSRLLACVDHHAQRLSIAEEDFELLLNRLVNGDLGYPRMQSNVLRDLCFAQALELKEAEAAVHFEREWMPFVRRIAMRTSPRRGEELVENFQADLILPRENSPARIAGYSGKTSFKSWLIPVVSNYCLSCLRGRKPTSLETEFDPPERQTGDVNSLESVPCEQALSPVFHQAVSDVPLADRGLLKFLILDEIPQADLARTLGIHSGNVTRRRQQAAAKIWQGIREVIDAHERSRQLRSCLDLILTGEDREMRQKLGEALASALPGGDAGRISS